MPLSVSVVIPAYGPSPHLQATLEVMLAATRLPDEVIISHSGPDDPSVALAPLAPRVRVMHAATRLLGGGARNRGARAASGDVLVFMDSDVRPAPHWLDRLIAALTAGAEAERFVVGSVGMAETGGFWGTTNWISEFSEQAPWRPAGEQTGGASCNMAVSRAAFEAAGGFAEDHQPGEDTLLFHRLRAAGMTQWFEPSARVEHFNQHGYAAFQRHQERLGYHSALVRQQVALDGSIATRLRPLGLLLWLARLGRIIGRMTGGGPAWWLRILTHGPAILVGTWIWSVGFLSRTYGASAD
ncbi:MAG: glycosyltransferase family 2 protein [Pseudomonadota bacterium]